MTELSCWTIATLLFVFALVGPSTSSAVLTSSAAARLTFSASSFISFPETGSNLSFNVTEPRFVVKCGDATRGSGIAASTRICSMPPVFCNAFITSGNKPCTIATTALSAGSTCSPLTQCALGSRGSLVACSLSNAVTRAFVGGQTANGLSGALLHHRQGKQGSIAWGPATSPTGK